MSGSAIKASNNGGQNSLFDVARDVGAGIYGINNKAISILDTTGTGAGQFFDNSSASNVQVLNNVDNASDF